MKSAELCQVTPWEWGLALGASCYCCEGSQQILRNHIITSSSKHFIPSSTTVQILGTTCSNTSGSEERRGCSKHRQALSRARNRRWDATVHPDCWRRLPRKTGEAVESLAEPDPGSAITAGSICEQIPTTRLLSFLPVFSALSMTSLPVPTRTITRSVSFPFCWPVSPNKGACKY